MELKDKGQKEYGQFSKVIKGQKIYIMKTIVMKIVKKNLHNITYHNADPYLIISQLISDLLNVDIK